jgi:folate-dependent phosphoribosylglycinamide formyltransferase PurN
VAILTNRHPLHYFLIHRLAHEFEICQVIYERQSLAKSLRLITRRARKLGWGKVAGQLAFVVCDRLWIQPASQLAIERLLAGQNHAPPGDEVPQTEVESINEPAVAKALEAVRPAVCVVSGTSIIHAHILEKAPVFLNIHAGITPRYRGAHGAFWAVYEGRPDLAGVTVHAVDMGIDTGGIVAQAPIQVEAGDTLRSLVAKQYLAALPLVVEAVGQALNGSLTTRRRADLDSRLWYSPTPVDYWRFRRQLSRLT